MDNDAHGDGASEWGGSCGPGVSGPGRFRMGAVCTGAVNSRMAMGGRSRSRAPTGGRRRHEEDEAGRE